jgi:hypothetical protein
MLVMTDLIANGPHYYGSREYNGKYDATLFAAAKRACDLEMLHIFQNPTQPRRKFSSGYDPIHETIQGENGDFFDRNGGKPVKVSGVLLLGSNYLIFSNANRVDIRSLSMTQRGNTPATVPSYLTNPENVELVGFAATLHAKTIFDKHGIPAAIFCMPSDLPGFRVEEIGVIREEFKGNKTMHPAMQSLIDDYGFSNIPIFSNMEIQSNPLAKQLISAGRGVWYALEVEFRKNASRLLEKLVKNGFENVAEQYFPGGLAEWRAQNKDRDYKWSLILCEGTYNIGLTSKRIIGGPIYIPIGGEMRTPDRKKTIGLPRCALR